MSTNAAAAAQANGNHVVQRHEEEQQPVHQPAHQVQRHRRAPQSALSLSPFFASSPMASMIRSMEQEMNDLFQAFDTNLAVPVPGSSVLAVDVHEDDHAFTITADLPGFPKDSINIKISPDNVLTIAAERKQEKKEENSSFHRVERSWGSYARSFKLPDNVDVDAIKAKNADGVLELVIPKKPQEVAEERKVEIE